MKFLKGLVNATATYGKIEMSLSMIISAVLAVISLVVLIWLITSYEKNYVTSTATIAEDPKCNTQFSKQQKIITGTVKVTFRYNDKNYAMTVNTGDGCYNLTKNSTIKIKFDPNNIDETIILASNDLKNVFIAIASVCLVIFILSVIYDYFLRNNKVAQTLSGAEGIGMGIRNAL